MSFYGVNRSPMIRSRYQEMTGRQDISSSVGNIALVMTQLGLLPAVGSISTFAGSVAPTGYLLCDGSAVSRTLYHSLFQIIGITYGSGDGSTTFNLPNLKGKFAVGFDSSQAEFDSLSETGGEKTHTLTIAEMPSHNHGGLTQATGAHTHTITDPGHTHSYINQPNTQNTDNAFATESAADNSSVSQTTGSSVTGITINSAGLHAHVIDSQGGGQPHNNLPPYIVLNYIIKC